MNQRFTTTIVPERINEALWRRQRFDPLFAKRAYTAAIVGDTNGFGSRLAAQQPKLSDLSAYMA
jgi:hypothetical protein